MYHLSKLYYLLIFLSGYSFAYAKKPKPVKKENTVIQLDQPLSNPNSLLWQVSGNGLKNPSYLFGTIHQIDQADFFLGNNLEKKIKNSKTILMEIDIQNVDPIELALLSLLPENKSIKNYLSDTDFTALEKFAIDSIGISKQMFTDVYAKLKPFFLEQLIITNQIKEKVSYENEILKLSEQNNATVVGLETMTEQLKLIDEVSIEDQLESIIKTVKNYSGEAVKLKKLIQIYKAQQLTEIVKMFNDEDDEKQLKAKLVDKRNHNWIPKLITHFNNHTCFVAVGAGHLAGEHGLIQLLKNKGYTVDPISIDN